MTIAQAVGKVFIFSLSWGLGSKISSHGLKEDVNWEIKFIKAF